MLTSRLAINNSLKCNIMTYLNIPTVRNASRKFCVNTGMTGTLASIAILANPTRLKPIKLLLERRSGP